MKVRARLVTRPESKSKRKPKTFGDCLRTLPPKKRSALQKLRKSIRSAAPNAKECVSYGLPAFRVNGKFLVAIGAGANHCAFYVGSVLRDHKAALRSYDTSKGTIRFQPGHPLPAVLVRKLVKARIAQISR